MREQFLLLKQQDEEKDKSSISTGTSTSGSGLKKWHIIDASKSFDEVHNNIVKITNQVIEKIGGSSSIIDDNNTYVVDNNDNNNNNSSTSNNNDHNYQYIQKLWIH